MLPEMERGIVVSNSLFSLTLRIILSTCTHKRAMDCVLRTSTSSIWVLLERKVRRWTVPGTRSSTRKPLSTMMALSGVKRDVIPDWQNTSLSLMEPSKSEDTKARLHEGTFPPWLWRCSGTCSWRRLHSEGAGMKEFGIVALCSQGQLVYHCRDHESHVEDWPSQLQEISIYKPSPVGCRGSWPRSQWLGWLLLCGRWIYGWAHSGTASGQVC